MIFLSLYIWVPILLSQIAYCCETGDSKLKYNPEFNVPESSKWQKYVQLIKEANIEYSFKHENQSNISLESCELFTPLIEDDLKYFEQKFGKNFIDKNVVERTEKSQRAIHYQVIHNRLYRQEKCSFPARCEGVEHFLRKLLKHLPNMDLFINVRDYPQVGKYYDAANQFPILSFSKDVTNYADITYPAWTFWSGGPSLDIYPRGIGRWDLQRESLLKAQARIPWSKKQTIGFFRGSRTSAERDPIVLLGRKRPDLIDSRYTKNQAWKSPKDTLNDEPAKTVTFEEHCQYKYLFNARGVAASFRLKHLFLCRSLVINIDSDWIEFFYPPLKPWIHYVPVEKDMKNAEEIMEFLVENDDISARIARKGFEFVKKHLTMDCIEFYWKTLLEKYSQTLLSYRPSQPAADLIDITNLK